MSETTQCEICSKIIPISQNVCRKCEKKYGYKVKEISGQLVQVKE